MKTYQYQLIKYVHDHFTGEFLNVGIIIYSPENQFIDCRVTHKYQRLNSFFPNANGRLVTRVLKNIENRVKEASENFGELFIPSEHLDQITNRILPKDNSSIQLTEVRSAIDIDLPAALDDLFHDLVEKYIIDTVIKDSLSDEDVWKTKYKQYFDQYHILSKLTKHEVSTQNDTFTFEKSWKNEIWHCYEPVSFALKNKDSIKDKVYKWAGRIQGIKQTNEKVHLTLLTSLNPKHLGLKDFISSYLEIDNEKVDVDIVMDNDAENLAKQINQLLKVHNNG